MIKTNKSKAQTQLLAEIKTLLEKGDLPKKKDRWDKAAVIATFISSVLIASVGGIFTYFYNEREASRQAAQQDYQNRMTELDLVAKFMPYLTSHEDEIKKRALLAINTLGSTRLAAQLAKLDPSQGATDAITAIASSPSTSARDRAIAEAALQELSAEEHIVDTGDGADEFELGEVVHVIAEYESDIGLSTRYGDLVLYNTVKQDGWKQMEAFAKRATEACGGEPSSGISSKQWLLEFLKQRRASLVDKPKYMSKAENVVIDKLEKKVNEAK